MNIFGLKPFCKIRRRLVLVFTVILFIVIFLVCFENYFYNYTGAENKSVIISKRRLHVDSKPGDMGRPVVVPKILPVYIKKLMDDGWEKHAFNQYVSDLISVRRTLPDPRDEECKKPGMYLEHLPKTSVLICFHNEALSVLLRTVHSVLDRSPDHLIHQIILVDDFSDIPYTKNELMDYGSSYKKITIVRTPKRLGLIQARLLGLQHATGEVLTFLNSHCECASGWLEPLLDRIARNATTVVYPVIDIIDGVTFEYQVRNNTAIQIGGFDWYLRFKWKSIPERERSRRNHSSEPLWSPTMPGGVFSIDRKFFEKLGTYDSDFYIWGSENLELSFKTWMCGGTLETIPCSHVGHIYRKRSHYKWREDANVTKRNTVRLAEVWLDEYAKYYYEKIQYTLGDYGNITEMKALRERLQCKSFKWYLDNIYPERFIPGNAVASGEIRNGFLFSKETEYCLDSFGHGQIQLYPCHKAGGHQYWLMSQAGEIRADESCLDYASNHVVLYPCHGLKGNQQWTYNQITQLLYHESTKKCLSINERNAKLVMEICVRSLPRMQWIIENFNASVSRIKEK